MENSENTEENSESKVFTFEDSMKILQDVDAKLTKAQEDYKAKAIPLKKKKKDGEEVFEVDEEQLESLGEQYSILISSAFRFINPTLKNWKIDPLSIEEINNVSKAILNISEFGITKTVKKIESRFKSLKKLSKWINLIAVGYEVGLPRLDQLKKSVAEIKAKAKAEAEALKGKI